MQLNNLNKVLGITAASICTIFATGQSAQAFTTLNSNWYVVQDSFNDGTTGNTIGSLSDYEMFGMAAKVVDNQAYFAFNGNLDIEGDDGVGYGDLFFNFETDMSFKDASAAGKLFAVHFAPNDAGNGNLEYGLYENVIAKSVASSNSGHSGFQSYINKVESTKDSTPLHLRISETEATTLQNLELEVTQAQEALDRAQEALDRAPQSQRNQARTARNQARTARNQARTARNDFQEELISTYGSNGTVGFGDLTTAEAQEYLTAFNGGYQDGNHSIQNVIKTGTKVADDGFSLLSASELAGLDFGTSNIASAQTFGFKLDMGKLPTGNALLSILHECINDGMAIKVNFASESTGSGILSEDVPEPSSIVSLGLIGLALAGIRKKSEH